MLPMNDLTLSFHLVMPLESAKDLKSSLMRLPDMCYNTPIMTPYEACCGTDEAACRQKSADISPLEFAAVLVGAVIGSVVFFAALFGLVRLLVSL